ncbi:MAG: nickel-dependent lactate racemase [Thermodesulfobacteriota bacterium]|nr:nickel-dependent lactate racemase [Thermodesulfobacteriota bacterium]
MKERSITLKYGKKKLSFNIHSENLLGIIKPKEVPIPEDTDRLIESALNSPFNGTPFDDFFQRGDKVAVIVSDVTRYTASHIYLPILIDRLKRAGINNDDIRVVVALGIHRQQSPNELRMIVGDEVDKKVSVHNHNAFDSKHLTYLGKTDSGIKVEINTLVAESDKILLTGSIGFHYLAGFGGGRKAILPGVASFESCVAAHLRVLNPPELGGRHPMATTAVLNGNPFHSLMIEACEMVCPKFLFNTILSPHREILKIVSGDYVSAHLQGCDFLSENFSPELEEKADLVIVSSGGFPKDLNFIQAHKSIDHSINALKENGVMIVLARCQEGFGNPTFLNWFQYNDLMNLEKALRKNFEINGQTAYATLMKAKKTRIILVCELNNKDIKRMSMIPADTIDKALSTAYDMLGDKPSTYIIPDGGFVFPKITLMEG